MEAGRVLGSYTLERRLGAGGMGEVWAARHQRIGRLYAVKVLLPELAKRADALARFEREARALSALGHPSIVQIHDFAIEADGTAYLAMDLLEGVELSRALGAGPLSVARARRIAMDIAAGLGAAHRLGLAHRDLKPSNVFLVGQGERERAVLLDFGLAKALDAEATTQPLLGEKLTASGMILGTPHYMSPEQAQGVAIDSRADVWALGVVMYEMLTGRPPFDGPTLAAVFASVLARDPAPLPPSAGPLGALTMRCLEKDREKRPRDGNAVLAELESPGATEGSDARVAEAATLAMPTPQNAYPTPATRASASAADTRPMPLAPSRLAWIALPLSALLVLGLGLGAWTLWAPRPSEPYVAGPALVLDAGPAPDAAVLPPVLVAATPPEIDAGQDAAPPLEPPRPDRPHRVGRPAPAAPPPSSLEGRVPPGMESVPGARELVEAGDRMNEGDWAGCERALRHAPETAHILSVRMSCASNAHDRPELERVCARMHERFPTSPFNQSCATLLGLPP